jgi:DNA-binding beta-propeller fold protein YncE
VSVINTNTIVDTINTGGMAGGGVAGVAVSPTGPEAGDIYVANPGSDTVSVISP